MDKIVLIDGNNIAHAMYHSAKKIAWRSKKTDDMSFIENMTYHTFFNKLFSFIKNFKNAHYVIAWDAKGATKWRKEQLEGYKANRVHTDEMRDVLFTAMDNLREVLEYFPIYQMHVEGYEADDIIYQISSKMDKSYDIVIISTDQDMQQIPQQFNAKQYNPIKKDFAIIPEDYDICVYKALTGDSSDNIPGIKGIGHKTAEKIARKMFGDEVNYENVRPHLKTDKQANDFLTFYNVINIANKPSIHDLDIDWEYILNKKEINTDYIKAFFMKYRMKSHLGSFEKNKKLLMEYVNS